MTQFIVIACCSNKLLHYLAMPYLCFMSTSSFPVFLRDFSRSSCSFFSCSSLSNLFCFILSCNLLKETHATNKYGRSLFLPNKPFHVYCNGISFLLFFYFIFLLNTIFKQMKISFFNFLLIFICLKILFKRKMPI